MRRLIAVFAYLLLTVTSADARSVHVVIVGDTNDFSIGVGIQANVDKMKDFFALVGEGVSGKAAMNIVEITGDKFSCDKINDAIKNLNVGREDTVFFYYAGHGFRRSTTQTKFPEFYCYPSNSRSGAQLSQVVADIVAKGPQLTIEIADSCNKDDTRPTEPTPEPDLTPPPNVARAIKHLFLEHRGVITISGSTPGQYSWYRITPGPAAGGFFTKQLLEAMYGKIFAATRRKPALWAEIVPAATVQIEVPGRAEPTIQQPQYDNTATDAR